MRKFTLISVAVLALAASAVATSAAAGSTSKAPLIVAMNDPGCHWFYVGGGPNHRQYVEVTLPGRTGDAPQPRRGGADRQGPERHQDRARRREADAQGEGHLPHHDGQAGPRRQPSDPQGHLRPHAHSQPCVDREGPLRRAFSVIRLHGRFAVTATTLVAGPVIEVAPASRLTRHG